ncbi:hypothetical protein IAT40_007182 [Kwoniella sp. CBS 6097]
MTQANTTDYSLSIVDANGDEQVSQAFDPSAQSNPWARGMQYYEGPEQSQAAASEVHRAKSKATSTAAGTGASAAASSAGPATSVGTVHDSTA